jgi:hypothetical protein
MRFSPQLLLPPFHRFAQPSVRHLDLALTWRLLKDRAVGQQVSSLPLPSPTLATICPASIKLHYQSCLASTTLSKSAPANRPGKSPPLLPHKSPRREEHQHKCQTLSRDLVKEETMAMDTETIRETTTETTALMVHRMAREDSR